jgi:putative tricarboxylic transport membrane protein
MMGIQPGPTLVIDHTALAFQMILTMALSVIIAAIICYFGAPFMVKVTQMSPHLLFGILLPLILLGAYVGREYDLDIVVIGITSILGLCIKRFGFSAPSIILGFVMGDLLERYLVRSLDMFGARLFWSSPTAVVLTAVIIICIFWSPIQSMLKRLRGGRKGAMEAKA